MMIWNSVSWIGTGAGSLVLGEAPAPVVTDALEQAAAANNEIATANIFGFMKPPSVVDR